MIKSQIKNIDDVTAESVHLLRISLRMNQAQFWGAIGVIQSTGSNYENAVTRMPSVVKKHLYATHVLGIAVEKRSRKLSK